MIEAKIKYAYENPLDVGYQKVNLSLRQLYKLGLGKRGKPIFIKAVVFFNLETKRGIIEYRLNWLAKVVMVLLFPVLVFLCGIGEASRELKRALFQSKYGSFSCDGFFPSSKPGSVDDRIFNACMAKIKEK